MGPSPVLVWVPNERVSMLMGSYRTPEAVDQSFQSGVAREWSLPLHPFLQAYYILNTSEQSRPRVANWVDAWERKLLGLLVSSRSVPQCMCRLAA